MVCEEYFELDILGGNYFLQDVPQKMDFTQSPSIRQFDQCRSELGSLINQEAANLRMECEMARSEGKPIPVFSDSAFQLQATGLIAMRTDAEGIRQFVGKTDCDEDQIEAVYILKIDETCRTLSGGGWITPDYIY